VEVGFRKTMNSMPPCQRSVALSTPWRSSSATADEGQRHGDGEDRREVSVMLRNEVCRGLAGDVVELDGHAAGPTRRRRGLVADDRAAVELDHPAAHRVDDGAVVGGHDHRGAGAVDAVEQAHDADRGGRVEVAGGLVGQQDQRPVHEGPGDRHALLLAAGELVGKFSIFLARPTSSRMAGTWVLTTCLGRPMTSRAKATFS
jgi:hypothetical protein